MPFVNDPAIQVCTVKRCSIMDCKERAVSPVYIERLAREAEQDLAMNA